MYSVYHLQFLNHINIGSAKYRSLVADQVWKFGSHSCMTNLTTAEWLHHAWRNWPGRAGALIGVINN